MSVSGLNHKHARVVQEVFAHPVPHNLEWADVFGLVNHLGSALERHDGKFEFTIGTTTEVFTKPHHKDMDVEDVRRLKAFLARAGVNAGGGASQTPAAKAPRTSSVVVLIDHHAARFFEPQSDGVHFGEAGHIEPVDPHGFERHLEHKKEADYRGERVPEATEYYERVAERLKGADAILLLGDATGKSSALRYLVQFLHEKHADIAAHVIDTVQVDLSAITIPEIQKLANEKLH